MRKGLLLSWCGIGLLGLSGCVPKRDIITQEKLVRRTQELSNAVAVGDQAPWKKYIADDCMYFDEMGRKKNKEALMLTSLPYPICPASLSSAYSRTVLMTEAGSRGHVEGDLSLRMLAATKSVLLCSKSSWSL